MLTHVGVSSPNFVIARLMKHESGLAVRLARERHVGRMGEEESDNPRSLPPSIRTTTPPFPQSHSRSFNAEFNFDSGGNEPRNTDLFFITGLDNICQ